MSFDPQALYSQMAQGAAVPPAEGPPTLKLTQPGEELFGIVRVARFDIQIPGQQNPTHLIEVDDFRRGPVTFWLSAQQLEAGFVNGRNQLGRRVREGDIVYVRFDGKSDLAGGKTLNNFSINLQAGNGQGPAEVAAPQPQPVQQAAPAQQQQQYVPQQAPQAAPQQGYQSQQAPAQAPPAQQWGQQQPQQWQQPPAQPAPQQEQQPQQQQGQAPGPTAQVPF